MSRGHSARRMLPWCAGAVLLAACGGGGGGGGGGGSGSGSSSGSTTLGTSAGTGNGGALFASKGGSQPAAFSSLAKPDLTLSLQVCTYVGGAGEQYLRSVAIQSDGSVVAQGSGFTLTYTKDSGGIWSGVVTGDASTNDTGAFSNSEKPSLTTTTFTDTRHGRTYTAGYLQVAADLQQPFVDCANGGSAAWTFWKWSESAAKSRSLTADSRCYDVWPMPDGDIGIKCWSDGGNTTLNRHPRSIDTDNAADDGSWQNGANSMGTYYLRANPLTGKPISGTFLRGVHATFHAMDPWGRIFVPRACTKAFPTVSPSNPFGHSTSAGTGLFVLDPSLRQMEANLRLGGTPSGVASTYQLLRGIALRGNILVLCGTTNATDLPTTANAVQSSHGGGNHDGWLVIIKLWADGIG